jgi:aspartyl protease family protein
VSQSPNRQHRDNAHPWAKYTDSKVPEHLEDSEDPEFSRSGSIAFVVTLIFGFGLIFFFTKTRGAVTGFDKGDVVWAGAVTIFIAFWVRSMSGNGLKTYAKQALIWFGIILACVTLYAYKAELGAVKDRVVSVLIPDQGMAVSENSHVYTKAGNGHFYIQGQVNGVPIIFLADTGATNVVLAKRDAERAGYDAETLVYDRQASTANGLVDTARIELDELRVAGFVLDNLPAYVNDSELDESLLGMNFFSRLEGYEVEGDALTIRWRGAKQP